MPTPIKRKIGLWSGASPALKSEFKAGMSQLRKLGFEVLGLKKNISLACKPHSKEVPYLAGDDPQKVEALLTLLQNPTLHEILCVRGGYGTLRLLEHLEKVKLPKTKKRLWGFSDQTSLQNYLWLKVKMPWVHAPMLTSNAFISGNKKELAPWQESTNDKQRPLKFTLKKLPQSYAAKRLPLKAPLLGGNLTCLASIYTLPNLKAPRSDFFLFLEDISERSYRLDRMLTMLRYAGYFKNCRAIFLGYFTDCPNWSGVIKKFSRDTKIPVYYGLPAGHARPNIALPMGEDVQLRLNNKNFGTLEVLFPNLKIQG